jgi:glycosyltransferase involved in cell wall biosynthesis
MMVRSEGEIIDRCLESVRGLIDHWVICDTGSSDDTRERVRAALAGIPGELHDTGWVDFGHNRTELLGFARGAADYLLLLDADMTVEKLGPLGPLGADAYLLRETGALDFGVIRLVRGDRRWWYEGSTHEHIATDGQFAQEPLPALAIAHHADGSSRWGKLARDAGLLKRDLSRNPNNARAVFYLAQTYRDMGHRELAIDYYRRRVELGGWDEEVFYSNLQEGVLRSQLAQPAATAVLLEAWERRPTRAEPLYELAREHRQREAFAAAHLFASRGLEIPYPTDVLFIHRWVYEWGLRLERAMAAAGLGRLADARDDLRELLRRPHLPPEIEEYARARLDHLRQRHPRAASADGGSHERLGVLAPSLRIGEIRLDVKPAWPTFNPSIASDGDGFRMVVRTANYAIERGVLHAEGVLNNINYMLELDRELAVRSVTAIGDRSSGPRRYPSDIQGYEDCRLFQIDGDWYATATVCDLNPIDRREIALLRLEGSDVVEVHGLLSPHPERHEKNWMPFVVGNELLIVYRCGPTIVLRCDPASGELERRAEADAPELADEFRGGSQGVAIDGGHLFVVHEVDRSGSTLRYLHRFLMLDEGLALSAVSQPFTFTSDRVEFCAGMARREAELVLSFGVSDAAAGLALLSLDEALALLEPRVEPTSSAASHDG